MTPTEMWLGSGARPYEIGKSVEGKQPCQVSFFHPSRNHRGVSDMNPHVARRRRRETKGPATRRYVATYIWDSPGEMGARFSGPGEITRLLFPSQSPQGFAIKTGGPPVIQELCVTFLKELNGWSIPRKYVQHDPKAILFTSDGCHMRKQSVAHLFPRNWERTKRSSKNSPRPRNVE